MADYTNKNGIKMIDEFFRINPVYEDPILQQFGSLDLTDVPVMDRYVQFDAVLAKANIAVADDLLFSSGDSINYPGWRKAKIFQYGCTLSELEYRSLNTGRMGRLVAERVQAEIQASKGLMLETLLKWMIGYQALTSETAYDPDWVPLLHAKAATGTVSNPEDISSTAGTATAYAYNFTGTNKSKDFILNTFGAAIKQARAQRDSTTGEQMIKRDLGSNTFLHLLNPDNVMNLSLTHPYNGVQDDQNVTYEDQIKSMPGTHTIMGSYDIDAAASTAEDGTNVFTTVINPKENFKIGYVQPFTEDGWEPYWAGNQKRYYKRAWMKVVGMAKPYNISGSWKKAVHHATYVYMNDAG